MTCIRNHFLDAHPKFFRNILEPFWFVCTVSSKPSVGSDVCSDRLLLESIPQKRSQSQTTQSATKNHTRKFFTITISPISKVFALFSWKQFCSGWYNRPKGFLGVVDHPPPYGAKEPQGGGWPITTKLIQEDVRKPLEINRMVLVFPSVFLPAGCVIRDWGRFLGAMWAIWTCV